MNMADVRAAAEAEMRFTEQPCPADHPFHDIYESLRKRHRMQATHILSTIPDNPDGEITPEWLRGEWGFESPVSGAWNHNRITGTFCFECGGLSWWHVGNLTVSITTRYQFTQLMNIVGIQPRGKGER